MLCSCCRNVNWNKVFVAALIYTIIATFIRQIEALLTIDYYMMPQYFGAWSKMMMPKAGPPPMEFYITSLIFTFITGVMIAAFYEIIKSLLPKDKGERIFCFTAMIFSLAFVFFTLPVYLLINLPFTLLVYWVISSLVIFSLGSVVFTKVLK